MVKGHSKPKGATRAAGIVLAGAALAVGLSGSAQAAGGKYSAYTKSPECAYATGTYYWYSAATYNGKRAYNTQWNFQIGRISCNNVSLYTKYNKWDSGKKKWVSQSSYKRINSSGTGSAVADVRIFVCEVGNANSCGEIRPA
ncbi:hypothetical protein ACIGZH_33875 [Streptomyces sp. NPDC058319]|uniref:hypothetical protein n=1 Tax=unclassified Streptomyces TaxID=2593676 RepID=UPI0007F9920D|nr:hypothetical protein A8713_036400 [Streptomyces sp. SAT1]